MIGAKFQEDPAPTLRTKRRQEEISEVQYINNNPMNMNEENSLKMDKEKSLNMDKEKSLRMDKEKSLRMDKEKSLETLWHEVQALDSSPNRPSSLSSQVRLTFKHKTVFETIWHF